jgi:hypothetical protein
MFLRQFQGRDGTPRAMLSVTAFRVDFGAMAQREKSAVARVEEGNRGSNRVRRGCWTQHLPSQTRSPEAKKALALVFEAAVRKSQRLEGYGLIDVLCDLSKLSGQGLGMSISETEMRKIAFVIFFARRLVEHLVEHVDPIARNQARSRDADHGKGR